MAKAVGLLLVVISAVSAWLTKEGSAASSRRLVWKEELSADLRQNGRGILQQVGDLDGEWEPVSFPVLEEANAQSPSAAVNEIAVAPEEQLISPQNEIGLENATVNASQNSSMATAVPNENRTIETEIVPMLTNIGPRRKPIHQEDGLSSIILVMIAVAAVAVGLFLGGVWGLFYLKKLS
ncbi:hypothetical protein BSKO_01111 [Bryopsis sp. KO-2023]|nr:hypothetical protein BSKO_01111 [Bryopsis sp. KO-2023]